MASKSSASRLSSPGITQVVHLQDGAKSVVDSYSRFYHSNDEEEKRERERNTRQLVESFYELVTDFYEYGYGQNFHFAPVSDRKSFDECIEDYQKEIARAINVKPGSLVLVNDIWLCMLDGYDLIYTHC